MGAGSEGLEDCGSGGRARGESEGIGGPLEGCNGVFEVVTIGV